MESRLQARNIQRAWYNYITTSHYLGPSLPEYDRCLISNDTLMYFGALSCRDEILCTALLQLIVKKNILVVLAGTGNNGKSVLGEISRIISGKVGVIPGLFSEAYVAAHEDNTMTSRAGPDINWIVITNSLPATTDNFLGREPVVVKFNHPIENPVPDICTQMSTVDKLGEFLKYCLLNCDQSLLGSGPA